MDDKAAALASAGGDQMTVDLAADDESNAICVAESRETRDVGDGHRTCRRPHLRRLQARVLKPPSTLIPGGTP